MKQLMIKQMKIAALFSTLIFMGACASSTSEVIGPGPQDDPYAKLDCSEGEVTAGIVGGKTVADSSWLAKGTVFLIAKAGKDGNETSVCTGSLIDRNIIMTAAHCVDKVRETFEKDLRIMMETTPVCTLRNSSRPRFFSVDRLEIHPNWEAKGVKDDGDVALLRISTAAPSDKVPFSLPAHFIPLSVDTDVTVTGYGSTHDYGDSDVNIRLRVTEVRPLNNESIKSDYLSKANSSRSGDSRVSTYDIDNSSDDDYLFFDQTSGHGICSGDSGGPALLRRDGLTFVIGVASKVFSSSLFSKKCGEGAMHTNVFHYRSWIEEKFKGMRNSSSLKRTPFI